MFTSCLILALVASNVATYSIILIFNQFGHKNKNEVDLALQQHGNCVDDDGDSDDDDDDDDDDNDDDGNDNDGDDDDSNGDDGGDDYDDDDE